MGVFRRSLAEDKVDHYNHTFAVLFLLILSLVTWLLPLSPHLQPKSQPAATASGVDATQSGAGAGQLVPRFTATCWCPEQFTFAMVAYTNAVCAAAYNRLLQGDDPDTSLTGAGVYYVPFEQQVPVDRSSRIYIPKVTRKTEGGTPNKKVKMATKEDSERQEKADAAWYFIHVKTPFALFLLAICLAIPYLVWALLSSLVLGINVDQTLVSAQAGASLDSDSRKQLHDDLARAAAESVRARPGAASTLYLLLKLLVCVAVVAELIVVHGSLLPQAKSLKDDLAPTLKDDIVETRSMAGSVDDSLRSDSNTTYDSVYSSKLLLCDMSIRHIQNIQQYTLQCLLAPEAAHTSPASMEQHARPGDRHSPRIRVWEMYEALYLIVQTCLAVLTVVNVVSLLGWLVKLLAAPCRKRLSSNPDLPVDAHFLLLMACENTGSDIVKALSQSGAWGAGDEKERTALN